MHAAGLGQAPERAFSAEKVRLTDKIVQVQRSHSMRQWPSGIAARGTIAKQVSLRHRYGASKSRVAAAGVPVSPMRSVPGGTSNSNSSGAGNVAVVA